MTTSLDRFLDGRVVAEQPQAGYRAAIDPIFLAAAIDARPGQTLFEAGAGVGVASLCLAARVKEIRIDALEVDRETARLLTTNITRNNCADAITPRNGDLFAGGDPGSYDQVFSNPPYFEETRASASPDSSKAKAHLLEEGGLERWIAAMLKRLKPKGTATLILPTEALDRALAGLGTRAGRIVIFPLWPKTGQPARRLLIQAKKGSRGPMSLNAGLVLHEADGRYTPAAQNVLREAAGLALQGPPVPAPFGAGG